MKKHHRPPSRVKYDNTHPIVSVRVEQELYKKLKNLQELSGKSVGDILREALKEQAPSAKKAHNLGYLKAMGKYRVTYRCSRCGDSMDLSTDAERKAAAEYMREHGWHHGECP